jgi:cell division transport system ATP-binding protein
VEELLTWVALEDHMQARPPTLSGGQQQRVAIARAVIARPKILFADEPTGNVDNRIAARLMHLFEELNKLGTTIIIATHNESLINNLNRPIIKLENGRLAVSEQSQQSKISLGDSATETAAASVEETGSVNHDKVPLPRRERTI